MIQKEPVTAAELGMVIGIAPRAVRDYARSRGDHQDGARQVPDP